MTVLITPVIWLFAVAGAALHIYLYQRTKRLELRLRSVLDDTAVRLGLSRAAEQLRIGTPALLYELGTYLKGLSADQLPPLRAYLQGRDWEKDDLQDQNLQLWRSILLTVIESFPLLGIIGTATAMAQSASIKVADGGQKAAEAVGAAGGAVAPGFDQVLDLFGVATGTTILGLTFAVFFMFTYSWISTRISRALEEARTYRAWVGEAYALAGRREA